MAYPAILAFARLRSKVDVLIQQDYPIHDRNLMCLGGGGGRGRESAK